MMRSLFSGVSGLRVHQARMDVIGNNIANVNTIGFKASRMTFADAMLQRISGASADNPATGRAGRNPMQIGLGVNIGSIDNLMTQGAAMRTDRALDASIQGNGFFIVSDVSGTFFTRAGNIDWNGHTFSINGMQLMGWNAREVPVRSGNWEVRQGTVEPLRTPAEIHFMNPQTTTFIDTIGNLNPNDRDTIQGIPDAILRPVRFYDSLGNFYIKDVIFQYHPATDEDGNIIPAPNTPSNNTRSVWSFHIANPHAGPANHFYVFPGGDRENGIPIEITMGWDPGIPGPIPGDTRGFIMFSPNNGTVMAVGTAPPAPAVGADTTLFTAVDTAFGLLPGVAPTTFTLNFNTTNPLFPPAIIGIPPDSAIPGNTGSITMEFSALRQQGGNTTVQVMYRNGNAPGTLEDISIGPDGRITGRFSNGQTRVLAQIPLAMFRNPAGLERMGNNLWATTANSGAFDGVGFHGVMMGGTLEMSNVDLAAEFTEMITTQRGFQANSRTISTSDEMLMELVNLRR